MGQMISLIQQKVTWAAKKLNDFNYTHLWNERTVRLTEY